jgi:exopolyphosphatase/guanosine-5'-triphosphate,3'-diphosphate pyrophosphatase
MKLAVLDLGTNTFHLLIAEVKKDCTWSKVLNERVTVKLGKGGIGNNIITKSSYTRGMKALERFSSEIKKHKDKESICLWHRSPSECSEWLRFCKGSPQQI